MRPIRQSFLLLIAAVVASACLTGCSIGFVFFIVNTSNQPTTIIFKRFYNLTHIDQSLPRHYLDSVITIDNNSEKRLTQQLPYKLIDSQTIYIVVPPKSTVLLSRSFNRPIPADSLTLIHHGRHFTYSSQKLEEVSDLSGGLLSKRCLYH